MEVYHCQHQLNGTHPWRKLTPEVEDDPSTLECQCRNGRPAEHTIFNLSLPVFILSCALVVVTAALIIAGGLLASKINNLEKSIPSLAAVNTSSSSSSSLAGEVKTTPTPPTLLVSGWTYLGCYYDSDVRLLPDASTSLANLTNGICGAFCITSIADAASKPRHFGTQHGGQCFCGSVTDAVLASKMAPEWLCNDQCRGRAGMAETCGGNWVLSLWERDASR